MKTPLKVLLPVLLFLTLPYRVQAQPNPGFTYTTSGGTIAITGYSGTDGNVAIPTNINGLTVTSI